MNKEEFSSIYAELFLGGAENNFDTLLCQKKQKVVLQIFLKICWIFILQIRYFFAKKESIWQRNFLVCLTTNQARSVITLKNDNNIVVRPFLDSAKIESVDVLYLFPLRYFYTSIKTFYWLGDIENVPFLLRLYLSISYFYYYDSFLLLFKKQRPRSVTITNPSHVILRSAIHAAKALGITTVYLPHASPSRLYPTITTDYALLEGEDGLEYYTFTENCKKLLVGSPRLDPYKHVKPVKHDGINIMVATNLLDDIKKVKNLINEIAALYKASKYYIILRPHPNQPIDKKLFCDVDNLSISDSHQESCIAALSRSDILISGNSTIFFEAVYLPVSCYYYDFIKEENCKDSYELSSYSFIKKLSDVSKLNPKNFEDNMKDMERIDYSYGKYDSSLNEVIRFYAEVD